MGFEDGGKGLRAKEHRQPPEGGGGGDADPALEPRSSADALILTHEIPLGF